jgi:hypothetical protein
VFGINIKYKFIKVTDLVLFYVINEKLRGYVPPPPSQFLLSIGGITKLVLKKRGDGSHSPRYYAPGKPLVGKLVV